MGNAWYCKKCEEGKIALSNSCVDKFVNEKTGQEYTSEQRWMNKLQCIDDVHTRTHGLTIENFNELVDQLDIHSQASKDLPCKNRYKLIECLKQHPNCMIKCMKEMEEFIDCVDTMRIGIIKSKIRKMKKSTEKIELF